MNANKLVAAQAAMKAKHEQAIPKPRKRRLTESQELRRFIRLELKKARRLNQQKHKAHRRYLNLKKDKRKLIKAVRDELRLLLVSFREMNAAMRDCKASLRGGMDSFAKQSKNFQMGFELGKEYAALNPEIKRQGDSCTDSKDSVTRWT